MATKRGGTATGEVERIAIFGLGKLGAVVAACYASRGVPVLGVDVDRDAVRAVAEGRPPVSEPGLDRLYAGCADRLDATTDVRRAVLETDASLLLVPTPSEPDGSYSLRFVLDTCRAIGAALAEKGAGHLVVLKSTVLPGASQEEIIPVLEAASGLRCGEGFGFVYAPEFVALGSVIHDVFHPDLCLLGESDPGAGDRMEGLYRRLLEGEPPLARMGLTNAELAKLAVNAYVTQKISFANALALLCERLPGGDVDVVTQAIGRDRRIGRRYLKGGLGFGGPCFPRDNRALVELARRRGLRFETAEASDALNEKPARAVVERVAGRLRPGARVGVLGLAYKPQTAVVEASQGILIARELAARGLEVTVWDPRALHEARGELGDRVKYAESGEALVEDQDAVIVATPCSEFAELDWDHCDAFVLDCWGLLQGHDGHRRARFGAAEPAPGGRSATP